MIARLLAYPGKEFHVLDLLGPTGTANPRPLQRAETLAEPGDVGEVLDARARRQYKERVMALEHELEEAEVNADAAKAERIRAERDFVIAELSAAYGLAGRVRRAEDPVERARWTVTKRVHTTLRNLNRLHPPLARHLQSSIKTGYFCSYFPEQETSWVL